jgi:hypothetical protein
LLDAGIITPEQFGLRAWNAAVDTIVTTVREDFEPAMNTAMMHFDSFGEAVTALGGGVRRVFTGDFRDASQVVRDDFNKALVETIEGLKETGATANDIEEVAKQMRILAMTAEGDLMRGLFTQAAVDVQTLADETAETEENLIKAAKAGDGLTKTFGETTITAGDVRKSIKEWLKPLKEAKGLMEDILGLTGEEDIKLRAEIAPIEREIEERNAAILWLKGLILTREDELLALGVDIDEVEDNQLITLEEQIEALEHQTERDENLIEQKKQKLEIEDKIDEELAAQLDLLGLQTDKMPALLSLTNEEQRTLALMVVSLQDGVPALKDWILGFQRSGEVLEYDVLDALMEIIENLEDGGDLVIDVSTALAQLGLVRTQAAAIRDEMAHMRIVERMRERRREGFQHGIRNFMGGLVRVGERGEELIRLPRGSDVIPHGMIGPALRGSARQQPSLAASAEVNITTSLLKDFLELKRLLLKEVDQKLDDAAARVGMTKPRYGTWGVGQSRI